MQKSHHNQPLRDSEHGASAQVQDEPGLPDAYVRKPLSREEAVSAAAFSFAGDHGLLAHHTWGG